MAKVRAGLIQMALKADTGDSPAAIRDKMNEAHLPLIEQAGKKGKSALRKELEAHFGSKVTLCMDARTTTARLNRHLHFAAENRLPMSTPQLFLGEQRVCEEDTDMGLVYTLSQLAPEVLP